MIFGKAHLCLAGLLLSASAAAAATHYVAPTGDDSGAGTLGQPLRTIQQAIDRAQPGDTVQVRTGTYQERIRFVRSGTANARIVVQGYPGETAVIDGTGIPGLESTDALAQIDGHDFITIRNLEIRRSSRNCIRVTSGTQAILEDLDVHDCGQSGIGFYLADEPSFSVVRNCLIHGVWESGILLWENTGGRFLIENNKIWDVVGHANHDGIQGNDTPYVIVRENEVSDVGSQGDYIDFGGDQNTAVSGNHHIIVEDNRVTRGAAPAAGSGVKLNNRPRRVIYRRNRIDGLGMIFYEQPFARVAVYHNTIVDSGDHALMFWNLDASSTFGGLRVKNNVLALSSKPLIIHSPNAVDGGPAAILMDGNVYRFGDSEGIEWAMSGVNEDYGPSVEEFARWRSETGQEPSGGTFTTLGLELLFDAIAGDGSFVPREGSPIVDSGVALTRTRSTGSGQELPVVETAYFTDGFGMTEGDMIQVDAVAARVVLVDEDEEALHLDRPLEWTENAPVSLIYSGSGPDAGAREWIATAPGDPAGLQRADTAP